MASIECECPECGFIPLPEKEEITNPNAVLPEDYLPNQYTFYWWCCPTCKTILFLTRESKGGT